MNIQDKIDADYREIENKNKLIEAIKNNDYKYLFNLICFEDDCDITFENKYDLIFDLKDEILKNCGESLKIFFERYYELYYIEDNDSVTRILINYDENYGQQRKETESMMIEALKKDKNNLLAITMILHQGYFENYEIFEYIDENVFEFFENIDDCGYNEQIDWFLNEKLYLKMRQEILNLREENKTLKLKIDFNNIDDLEKEFNEIK